MRPIVNWNDVPEESYAEGRFAASDRVLTPGMRERGGSLGVVRTRVPPGATACPFHHHLREDEVFVVLSGKGVLRYGDELHEIGPGDVISCPAGTGIAHQLANPFDADLEYLAIGNHDKHEVCGYPDTGKVMIRGLSLFGKVEKMPYGDPDPQNPAIFAFIESKK